jgi:hypothetical protein
VNGDGVAWLRVQDERGGERAQLRAQMSRGKWATGVRALKGRGHEAVAGERADVGVGERLGTGDLTGGVCGSARGDPRTGDQH